MPRLSNRTVVITGGNSGIGLASAHALRAEGANVVIFGRNAETVSAAAEEMLLIALIKSVVREERFQEAVWLTAIAVISATCLQHGATFALRHTAKRGTFNSTAE